MHPQFTRKKKVLSIASIEDGLIPRIVWLSKLTFLLRIYFAPEIKYTLKNPTK